MDASIVDLRYKTKDILKAIDRGETVTVFYRGKKKAKIVPIASGNPKDLTSLPAFGMWKDREDMKDPSAYVRNLRKSRFHDL